MFLDRTPGAAAGLDRSALEHYVTPLRGHLDASHVTEVCLNQPGELWVERSDAGWHTMPSGGRDVRCG